MSRIDVINLTFGYEGSPDDIFEQVTFSIDTDWKLGFIGRNGKGKTTLLNLLRGRYEYVGSISAKVPFDYFPYEITSLSESASSMMETWKYGCEEWRVICELEKMETSAELLYRPMENLSHGERTKVMLAILFSGDNDFLLIDEPTNHLDQDSREVVKKYLQGKKGFLLVSHDRDLLDACIDHVLVLNRKTIEVQKGNFSSWWENKNRKDHFAEMENEKHRKEIASLKRTAEQSSRWAEKNESTKIGFNPIKEHDRFMGTRSYIGSKTKKMQARIRQYEHRIDRAIEEKEGLLCDLESPAELKLCPMRYRKERLLEAKELTLGYHGCKEPVLHDFDFTLMQGERVFLRGKNGCGKSTFLKALLQEERGIEIRAGIIQVGSGLIISYVNQDTGFLRGQITEFCRERGLEQYLFLTLLNKLDVGRTQYAKDLSDFSEGQKKKVLLAASLMTPAHLYIWDEPLNYIDVFSRVQLEELILNFQPTMILVEHDTRFCEKIATRIVVMD